MISLSNSEASYLEEMLLVLKRIAIRGKNVPLKKENNSTIDTFQHMEDEIDRLLAFVVNLRRIKQ